jgi:four helix bundle protein
MRAKSVDELLVYQRALDAAIEVSALLKKSGFRSDPRLHGQISSSSERVASLIAEGFGQSTDRHFAEYLHRSQAATYEIRNQLRIAQVRGFITEADRIAAHDHFDEIARMLSGLIAHLKREDRKERHWRGDQG